MMIDFIYAIHTVDDPDTYLYVGRSIDPKIRFKQHLREIECGTSLKCRVLRHLVDDGEELDYTILQSVPSSTPHSLEDNWIVNLTADGHPLTNSKGGDSNTLIQYDHDPNRQKTPWSVQLFEQAEWQRDMPRANKNEWSCYIKGIQFFRVGKSKLRMIHPDYGKWDIHGFDQNKQFENAVQMLTTGTEKNKWWMQQYKQANTSHASKLY